MKGNTVLTELKLVGCSIDGRDITHLKVALKENTSFTVLRLVDCSIGGSDIVPLKVALRDIHTLTALDLSENRSMGDSGIKEIGI